MKALLISMIFLCFGNLYSQNRYSTVSTSSYEPMAAPSENYYRAMAEKKMNEIGRKYQYYTQKVNENLQLNADQQFKNDLYEVQSYLRPLAGELSMEEAEWYVKKAERLFNKAVRSYNKRLKKVRK